MVNPAANSAIVATDCGPTPGYILKLIWLFVHVLQCVYHEHEHMSCWILPKFLTLHARAWATTQHIIGPTQHACWRWISVNLAMSLHVGIGLISKLTILTLMIYQVHTRMWFLEFIVYARINKNLNVEFRVKFIEHFARRSWSPAQVKTRGEHNSKWSKY
jgi:hypothetical protein